MGLSKWASGFCFWLGWLFAWAQPLPRLCQMLAAQAMTVLTQACSLWAPAALGTARARGTSSMRCPVLKDSSSIPRKKSATGPTTSRPVQWTPGLDNALSTSLAPGCSLRGCGRGRLGRLIGWPTPPPSVRLLVLRLDTPMLGSMAKRDETVGVETILGG